MAKKNLEKVIKSRIEPLLSKAMHRYLGVTINEINLDISDKLRKTPILDMSVDTSLKFKDAKNRFRRYYLMKLLQMNFGNVSEAAKIAGLDRRSIHRLIKKLKIKPQNFRKTLMKGEYIKQMAVQDMIEDTLEDYKGIIHPEKMEKMYENVPTLSKDIIKELPKKNLTLKEAEEEFERRYFIAALKENDFNISKTARKIGLRYETLHRKMKALGI